MSDPEQRMNGPRSELDLSGPTAAPYPIEWADQQGVRVVKPVIRN